jgi:hypothetical protein
MRNLHWNVATVLAAAVLASNAAYAQNQKNPQEPLKVQVERPSEPLDNLRDAVRELRQASVIMVDQHQQNPAAQKAFNDAQAAIAKVDTAIAILPNQYSAGKVRDASEWPIAAAHFDAATVSLDHAISEIQQNHQGKADLQAVQGLRNALAEVRQAQLALPAWDPTGSTAQSAPGGVQPSLATEEDAAQLKADKASLERQMKRLNADQATLKSDTASGRMSAESKDAYKVYNDRNDVLGENKDIAADKTGWLQMKEDTAALQRAIKRLDADEAALTSHAASGMMSAESKDADKVYNDRKAGDGEKNAITKDKAKLQADQKR